MNETGGQEAPLGPETVVRRAREVEFRRIDEDVYFLRLADETRELDGVASLLWRLLDGQRSLSDVAAEVASLYDVEFSRVWIDVVEFCENLLRIGFLIRLPA